MLNNTNHRVTLVFADPTDRRRMFSAVDPIDQPLLRELETILWCELEQAAPLIIDAILASGGRAVLAECVHSAWPRFAVFTDTELDTVLVQQ